MAGFVTFWQTYGPIITGGAVVVSACLGIAVLLANRAIARRRATLDIILHIESDGDLIEARNRFTEIKKSDVRSSTYGKQDKRASDESEAIRTILNINELVAVSIQEGVIDERVFRRWFNSAFIDDYKSMTGYIEETRKWKNGHIFKELETLANRWEATNKDWYAQPGWFMRKQTALAKLWRA